jgi:hypothetical protein
MTVATAKKAPSKKRPSSPTPDTIAPNEREFVLESLSGLTSVVHEANRELGTGEPIEIKIRAPRPGSFLVNLLIDPQTSQHVANLFAIGGVIISSLASAIAVWQALKGQRPTKSEEKPGHKVELTNANGNTVIVDQKIATFVLENATVNFNLARTFGALDGDPNVTSFEVLDRTEKRTLARVERDEFPALAVVPDPLADEKRAITVRTKVTIIKPSFDRKLKWEVVYSGNRIGALVTDASFYERIDKGEPFKKGNTLDVTLRVKQEYDSTLRAYMNKAYEIVLVHAHHATDQQESFLDQER